MTIPQTRPLARLAANEPRTMDVSFFYGNIIKQPVAQAVVNSANANLRFGSGVAGAIHGAAGQKPNRPVTERMAPAMPMPIAAGWPQLQAA